MHTCKLRTILRTVNLQVRGSKRLVLVLPLILSILGRWRRDCSTAVNYASSVVDTISLVCLVLVPATAREQQA